MINASKTLTVIWTALVALLLSACSAEILSDRETAPAAHALIHLQEPPAFPMDDSKRPFAAIADRDKRAPVGDAPFSLEESKPHR